MSEAKQTEISTSPSARDPFALLRQMTSEFDRAFGAWPSFRFPMFSAMKDEAICAHHRPTPRIAAA